MSAPLSDVELKEALEGLVPRVSADRDWHELTQSQVDILDVKGWRAARAGNRDRSPSRRRNRVVLTAVASVFVVAAVVVGAYEAAIHLGGPERVTFVRGEAAVAPTVPDTKAPPPEEPGPAPTTVSTVGVMASPGGQIDLESLNPDWVYARCDAVVLGRVVEELPLRSNPLAGAPDSDGPLGPIEHLPIDYKGYVLEVEKAYGPETIAKIITVYCLGSGLWTNEEGETYYVDKEDGLDLTVGTVIFAPLGKEPSYGTPELKADEFWAWGPHVTFLVDDRDQATRASGRIGAESVGASDTYDLSVLEEMALGNGLQASVIAP